MEKGHHLHNLWICRFSRSFSGGSSENFVILIRIFNKYFCATCSSWNKNINLTYHRPLTMHRNPIWTQLFASCKIPNPIVWLLLSREKSIKFQHINSLTFETIEKIGNHAAIVSEAGHPGPQLNFKRAHASMNLLPAFLFPLPLGIISHFMLCLFRQDRARVSQSHLSC